MRKDEKIKILCTEDIQPGKLCIPVFFRKPQSMVMDTDTAARNPKAVNTRVSWSRLPTDQEGMNGIENRVEEKVNVSIQPEMKLPKITPKGPEWQGCEDIHPFWLVRRFTSKDEDHDKVNCELISTEMQTVFSSDFESLTSANVKADPVTTSFNVTMPCIVNTSFIPKSEEAILKVVVKATPKKEKEPKSRTAFDQLAEVEAKKRRLSK